MRSSMLAGMGVTLLATSFLLLPGCGDKEEEAPAPETAAAGAPTTGPGGATAPGTDKYRAGAEAQERARSSRRPGQNPSPPGPQ